MNVVDYVKSRVEEGDPDFDLDWETAREIANSEAWALKESEAAAPYEGDVPFHAKMSVARVGRGKPFVLLDRPNSIDWNSKAKVREYLTTLIGKGEISLADNRRIRIGRELPREYTRSRYAEKAFRNMRLRKLRGKAAQHLDELIVMSGERSEEPSRHKARERGVYYRRTVDFGVMGHEAKRGYTAELLTYEVGGDERLYDLVNINEKPALTDSLRRTDRGALEILSPNRADLTGDNIPNRGEDSKGGAKFSVGRLYTGSAADYEKPSLHAVGTGEGAQVYGWGLYASNVRGIAEGYAVSAARQHASTPDEMNAKYKGKFKSEIEHDPVRDLALKYVERKGSIDAALKYLHTEDNFFKTSLPNIRKAAAWLERNRADVTPPKALSQHLYEQTWFTDRPEGDESHLLNWYKPVSAENWKRIIGAVKSVDGWQKLNSVFADPSWTKRTVYDNAEEVYNYFLPKVLQELNGQRGTPMEVSEFLARAGIDGVKYPADSYGKTTKNGDKAGWNYVSFRDDNIRVDHKWTDGVARFSIGVRRAMQDIADGRDVGIVHNPEYGDIEYGIGRFGKRGYGFAHIVESRMAKDGDTLDGAIDVAFRVGEAAESGTVTKERYNTKLFDLNGVRAIVAFDTNGNKVITGYEISADAAGGANRRSPAADPQPHVSLEEVVAALKSKLASLPTSDNIPQTAPGAQGGAKFSIGRVNASELPGSDIFVFKPKVESLPGGTRVADAPENMGERSNYGLAASRELMDATTTPLSQLGRLNPMSLPVSEMLVLWKHLTGSVKGPAVKAQLPGFSKRSRGGARRVRARGAARGIHDVLFQNGQRTAQRRCQVLGFSRNSLSAKTWNIEAET